MKNIKLSNNRYVGTECPPYILAEIGINHNGEFDLAVKLIEEAAKVGVDGVKFQRRTIYEMYKSDYLNTPYIKDGSFGNTYGLHKEFLEFSDEQLISLKNITESLGIDFIVSGFDFSGFDFIENNIDPPFHKIASPLVSHHPLLLKVASYGKPMVISTGMHSFQEINSMMDVLMPLNHEIVLLQCTTSYPTEDEDVNLNVLKRYREEFNTLVGYSSHDRGVILPAASVALGSCFIEKHFTLDRTMKGPDHIASVEPRGMELIVKYSKSVFKGLGTSDKQITDAELPAKSKHGYSIVASKDLLSGTIITEDVCSFKQPGDGLKPSKMNLILGKRVQQTISKDENILVENLN
jgi:sialic acid synthase